MDSKFEVIPLTDDELAKVGHHQLVLQAKPVYAPSIVKAYLRGRPWQFLTLDKIAEDTKLPLKQVRAIVLRMVADGVAMRSISKFKKKTHYYFFRDETLEKLGRAK